MTAHPRDDVRPRPCRSGTYARAVLATPVREATLTELVRDAQLGVQPAWNELVRRFEDLVWKIAHDFDQLSLGMREEVVGDTWERIVLKLHTVEEPEALPGWIATVARREALKVLRRDRLVPSGELADRADWLAPAVDARLIADEAANALYAAVCGLAEPCRTLLMLMMRDPRPTVTEIAGVLGMPRGSVGPTQGRCVKKVRAVPMLAPHIRELARD